VRQRRQVRQGLKAMHVSRPATFNQLLHFRHIQKLPVKDYTNEQSKQLSPANDL
jgi:hypothetical protein